MSLHDAFVRHCPDAREHAGTVWADPTLNRLDANLACMPETRYVPTLSRWALESAAR